jgi:hypothetical protein
LSLNATPVTFTGLGLNSTACCDLSAARADVTSIVKPIIDTGVGGIYNFNVKEGSSPLKDGEALVVVYSNTSLSNRTFAMLDGFSAVTGDTATLNFATPLDPTASGFNAEMFLGIGFSCCDTQQSTVKVNGTVITDFAGNRDDGIGSGENGRLITVGGFDDPFSTLLPTYANDHERYNLVPNIIAGDTSIKINTINPSSDDNIFLAGFYVTGLADVTTTLPVPEPETYAMMLAGLGLMGFVARRRKEDQV